MNYSSITRLDNRVAIMTGGASGIGFETAKALKECGARVVIIDINQQKGEEAAATLGVEFKAADLTQSARVREIAAWWLRRRVLGVFGPGQVYQQTIQTLQSDPDPLRRSYAATALGEFFAPPGVAACAAALSDSSAIVRAAAASALGRLNSDGNGALSTALSDSDSGVKLAALSAAERINSFVAIANVAALTTDPSADVRRRAIEVLDTLDAADTVVAVTAAAQNDSDATVRAEACHALGTFGDQAPSVLSVLQQLETQDPDTFVRDEAQIALLRL